MKKILVIGIGSRIMMDDAIGIILVEDLRRLCKNSEMTYMIGETDVDCCMEEALNYDNIIIIDAFLSGKQPGEITVIPLKELNKDIEDSFYSLHGMHLLSLLITVKLSDHNGVVGEWTEIIIDRQDIDSLTAVIKSIEGESLEQQQ